MIVTRDKLMMSARADIEQLARSRPSMYVCMYMYVYVAWNQNSSRLDRKTTSGY